MRKWLCRVWSAFVGEGRCKSTSEISSEQRARLAQLEGLFWLADAPLFIDERLVERFFDAVVRPKFEHIRQTEEFSNESEEKILGELGLKGATGVGLPEWLTPVKIGFEAERRWSRERRRGQRATSIAQLKPIWNAERQLEELTRHYLAHYRSRLLAGGGPLDSSEWPKGEWYKAPADAFTQTPRVLAFLDLPQKTPIIPTAAEFADGKNALLYEELAKRLATGSGGPTMEYPNDLDDTKGDQLRKDYWLSFARHYDSRSAMRVIEEAATQHGRINWIDFRILLDERGNTLHLHVAPAGNYDAGVFGYNFVRRGSRHGVRIVGTLKSKPDMNVMAIYDK